MSKEHHDYLIKWFLAGESLDQVRERAAIACLPVLIGPERGPPKKYVDPEGVIRNRLRSLLAIEAKARKIAAENPPFGADTVGNRARIAREILAAGGDE